MVLFELSRSRGQGLRHWDLNSVSISFSEAKSARLATSLPIKVCSSRDGDGALSGVWEQEFDFDSHHSTNEQENHSKFNDTNRVLQAQSVLLNSFQATRLQTETYGIWSSSRMVD